MLDPVHDDITDLRRTVDTGRSRVAGIHERIKRVFDIIFAAIALLALSPVLLVAAALVMLESRGPAFFSQERIGLNRRRADRRRSIDGIGTDRRSGRDRRTNIHAGRPFRIYKLRTMRCDAEKDGPTLACTNDPRITRIGTLLRKTRVDEIPQFINVIKGDMSIIGPRPERSFFINKIKQELPDFPMRLLVKPGITGLAQVENGYTQTIDEMKKKLFYDLLYISKSSLAQELKILCKTVFVVFTGKGAC